MSAYESIERLTTGGDVPVEAAMEGYWEGIAADHGMDVESLLPVDPSTLAPHKQKRPRDYSSRVPESPEAWLSLSETAIKFVMRKIYIPEYEDEDFRQDLIYGLLSAIPAYDPSQSLPTTFAAAIIYNSAVDRLRYQTAQKRTPGSRVHVKRNDRDEELRNGLLELGVPLSESHLTLGIDPLQRAIDSIYSEQLVRLIKEANLTDLQLRATAERLFYNGRQRKAEDPTVATSEVLSVAWLQAREKMASVNTDSGYSIFAEIQ